jgi:FKBP-type peptidyl-prolyl cis-trans isomerase (trigger factor)
VREEVSTVSPTLSKVVEEGRDELTPEEAEQFADEQSRQYLGMSIGEFKELASNDALSHDDPMVVHIALLAGVKLHSC